MKYIQTFRLHPTPEQAAKIRERFALAGAAYNWGLAETERVWEEAHRHFSLYEIKDYYQHHFNYEHHRTVTNAELNALNNLDFAYSMYFEKRAGKPRKKEPEQMVSYTEMASVVLPRSDSRRLHLPKVGRVPCNFYRPIQHSPTQVTVKERNGRFYAVFLTDLPEQPCTDASPEVVGIDLGLKTFATLSDGTEIPFPDHIWNRRAERREAHLQRVLKRRQEGSRRQQKAARRYARFMEHKANQVKDFHLQTAVQLCRDYEAIAVEHLNVEGMKQGHGCKRRNNGFKHYGLTAFLGRLKYRCARTGTPFLQIARYEPTTRRCHHCGYLLPHALPLDQRQWTCPECHTTHHRDVNAALNIKALGQRILQTRPAADGVVTSVEQSERTCFEAEKVALKEPAASPKEEPRHSITRLAKKKQSKPASIPQFLQLVTSNICSKQVSRIMGIDYITICSMRYHGVSVEWRTQMALEACERLRQTLIDELSKAIPSPPSSGQSPTKYAVMLRRNLSPWLRWKNIIVKTTGLSSKLCKNNEYQWRIFLWRFICKLQSLKIDTATQTITEQSDCDMIPMPQPIPTPEPKPKRQPKPKPEPKRQPEQKPEPKHKSERMPKPESPQPFYMSHPTDPDIFAAAVFDCIRLEWLAHLSGVSLTLFQFCHDHGTHILTPVTAAETIKALNFVRCELLNINLHARTNAETRRLLDNLNRHHLDLEAIAHHFFDPNMPPFNPRNRTVYCLYSLHFTDIETAILRQLPAYINSFIRALTNKFNLQAA